MKNSKKLVGQMIKHQRIKRNLTLEDLAEKLNTDRHYIWKIENGKINLTMDYLDKILTMLECNPKDFFKL